MRIFFRHGNKLQIKESVNAATRDKAYIQDFMIRRGVDMPSTFTFTARDISPADDMFLKLKKLARKGSANLFGEDQLYVDGKYDITWKQVLEVGNVVKITVNDEFRGVFFVSSMRRVTNDRMSGYTVSCIGIQTWLSRQSIHFDIGGEALYARKNKGAKSKFLEKFKDYVSPDQIKDAITPKRAITFLINKLLNGLISSTYGQYSFNDGSTIQDMIGLALSDVSYYGSNLAIFQVYSILSGVDYTIWDAINQYRSAPFHEIWVTVGGRYIELYDYQGSNPKYRLNARVYLPAGKEYIIFRPTPYDHPSINDTEISDVINPNKVITIGTLKDISLHTVEATFSGAIIGSDQIIESDLFNSDDNLYSVYKVNASGMRMVGGAADVVWAPVVDNQAMRQVGKRVFTATMEGLDVGEAIKSKNSKAFTNLIDYFRILQAKAYNWFKYNAKFNKGSIRIQWLPNMHEGKHFKLEPAYADEVGIYYLNSYAMHMNHKELTYDLEVTRGFPDAGFPKNSTDYVQKKDDKISDPKQEIKKSNTNQPKTDNNVIPPVAQVKKKTSTSIPKKSKSGGGPGKNRGGKGKGSWFRIHNQKDASKDKVVRVDDKTGDVYDGTTGQKVGNIRTFNMSAYVGANPRGFGANPDSWGRWNDLKLKILDK